MKKPKRAYSLRLLKAVAHPHPPDPDPEPE